MMQCCMCGKKGLSTIEDGGPECELSDGRWVCSRDCYETYLFTLKDISTLVEMVRDMAFNHVPLYQYEQRNSDGTIGPGSPYDRGVRDTYIMFKMALHEALIRFDRDLK